MSDAAVTLDYRDWSGDHAGWAASLGISREAIDLYASSDVIDLHLDTFIWNRIVGYDLTKRHGHGLFGARFYSQADLPRLREAKITGGIWVITTNPARLRSSKGPTFERNIARLREILLQCSNDVALVRTAAEYREAKRAGKHGAWFGVQGGNAFEGDLDLLTRIPEQMIIRVTLVHLSNSALGSTSAPLGGSRGVSTLGKQMVEVLNQQRIFVDLAHINRQGFFDALDAHSKDVPPIVTHTGVKGVNDHWRNLDDEQIRAIASRGGTIGVMYQCSFLGEPFWGGRSVKIVDHLEHIIKVGGEDCASLGSDWDGAIITPRDMPTCLELPRLVQHMLDRKWTAERIQRVLGGNWLASLARLRPDAAPETKTEKTTNGTTNPQQGSRGAG